MFEFGPQGSPCVSFARVSEAPDVVRKPLPDAAPCVGPTAHGVADDAVMKGEVLKTQLPGYWGLPRQEAAGGVESSRHTSPRVSVARVLASTALFSCKPIYRTVLEGACGARRHADAVASAVR